MGGAKALRPALAVLIVLAVVNVIYVGNIKSRDSFLYNYDTQCWYSAGTVWLSGDAPYKFDRYTETWTGLYGAPPRDEASFVYPPGMALVAIPLATLPWPWAAWGFRLLNFCALAVILWGMHRLLRDHLTTNAFLFYGGCVGLLGSVTKTMTQGQMAIIATAALVLMFIGWRERRPWLYVLAFVVAAIKPQLTLLFLAYTFFMGGLAYGLAAAAIVMVINVAVFLIWPTSIAEFQESLQHHMAIQMNQRVGYDGVPALLGETVLKDVVFVGGLLAGLAAVLYVVYLQRWRLAAGMPSVQGLMRHLLLLVSMTVAFMPIHRYDLAVQSIFLMCLPVLRNRYHQAVLLVLILFHNRIYTAGKIVHRLLGAPESIDYDFLAGYASSALSGITLLTVLWVLWRDSELRRERQQAQTPQP